MLSMFKIAAASLVAQSAVFALKVTTGKKAETLEELQNLIVNAESALEFWIDLLNQKSCAALSKFRTSQVINCQGIYNELKKQKIALEKQLEQKQPVNEVCFKNQNLRIGQVRVMLRKHNLQ